MLNRKARREQTARIIEEAERHVGYRAQPNRMSAFQLLSYNGETWNGTFIDRVLHDALGDFAEVRFVSTVAALGYYTAKNGLYRKPKAGDIVFFNFSTDPNRPFEQPHVGVVLSVRPDGAFTTVEGETGPGHPQGSQLTDGVFVRLRHVTDAIGFVRPQVRTVTDGPNEPLKMSYLTSNPTTTARAVETVQRALNSARNRLTFNRGKKDDVFKSAFGMYARESGYVKNRGELDNGPLTALSDQTGAFDLE